MTDKPIIFSAAMVRALLDGRKTQTRRLLKPSRAAKSAGYEHLRFDVLDGMLWWWDGEHDRVGASQAYPYAIGDRLYVRETFCPRLGYPAPIAKPHYRADNNRPEWRGLWKPSIHMPRWASRLTLTVTDVRAQRLQDISEADAVAEGAEPCKREWAGVEEFGLSSDPFAHRRGFQNLWNSLHGADAWDANPWVVALTFKVQRGNIDAA